MLNEILNIVGKTIDKEEVKQFIDDNGLKYPKKDTISLRANDRYYHIVAKKQGLELLFTIEDDNPAVIPTSAGKKGVYYPNLTAMWIRSNKINKDLDLPFGLKFGMNYKQIVAILGEPNVNRNPSLSQATLTWLIPTDAEHTKEYCISLRKGDSETFETLVIQVRSYMVMFNLYYPLEERSAYKDWSKPNYATRFVEWAIKREFFIETDENREGITKVRNNEISGLDFVVNYIKLPAIYQSDFIPEVQDFVKSYICRMGGNNIWYKTDIPFLQNKLGALDSKVVNDTIDQRYEEFLKEGWFATSKQLE